MVSFPHGSERGRRHETAVGHGPHLGRPPGLLAAALICYNVATAPPRVPASIAFSPAPVLNPYPELEGVVVHINRATEEELTQLPGIGPEKAGAIRAYVRDYGTLDSPEQLLEISGIGEKTLEQISPYLAFD